MGTLGEKGQSHTPLSGTLDSPLWEPHILLTLSVRVHVLALPLKPLPHLAFAGVAASILRTRP